MDNMWAYDIEMSVYSIVKAIAQPKLIGKYPNIYFTPKSKSTKTPTFPTVYSSSTLTVTVYLSIIYPNMVFALSDMF